MSSLPQLCDKACDPLPIHISVSIWNVPALVKNIILYCSFSIVICQNTVMAVKPCYLISPPFLLNNFHSYHSTSLSLQHTQCWVYSWVCNYIEVFLKKIPILVWYMKWLMQEYQGNNNPSSVVHHRRWKWNNRVRVTRGSNRIDHTLMVSSNNSTPIWWLWHHEQCW